MNGKRKRYYPMFMDVQGRRCVVVGGGRVAERKVRSLLACAARVAVVSPSLTRVLERLSAQGKVEYCEGLYRRPCLRGAALVIAATGDAGLNAAVARDATRRGIPVNVVDAPEVSTFIVPAVLNRGEISIGVSTNGTSPFLARSIREALDALLGPEYAEYSRMFAAARRKIMDSCLRREQRMEVYRRIAAARVPELLKAGRRRQAESAVADIVGGVRDGD